MVAAEGMANKHAIAFVGIELTIGFNDQLVALQAAATAEFQWSVKGKVLRTDKTDRVSGKNLRHGLNYQR